MMQISCRYSVLYRRGQLATDSPTWEVQKLYLNRNFKVLLTKNFLIFLKHKNRKEAIVTKTYLW